MNIREIIGILEEAGEIEVSILLITARPVPITSASWIVFAVLM